MTASQEFRCDDCSTPAIEAAQAIFGRVVAVVHDLECPVYVRMTGAERTEYLGGVLVAHLHVDPGRRVEWQVDENGAPHLLVLDLEESVR